MEDPTVYFAHVAGEQLGPLSRAELDDLARSGRLRPPDLVWQSGTPDWVPAGTLLSFAHEPEPAAPGPPSPEPPSAAPPPAARPAPVSPAPAPARTGASFLPSPASQEPASVGDRVRSLLDDISSFSLAEVMPFSRLADPEALGTPASWVLLVFGLAPLLVGTVVEDPLLRVRLFNFGCGALWTAFFVLAFRTGRPSPRFGITVFFATGILGVLLISILQDRPPLSWLYALLTPERPFAVRLVAYTGGVALLEEAGKGLILLLLARKLGGVSGPSDGVFYGLLSGLGFGVYAAMMSTDWVDPRQAAALTFHAGSLTIGLYSYFVGSVVKVVSLPLLHAVWTAIVGYFIGISLTSPRRAAAALALGSGIAVILHGLYETFLSQRLPLVAFLVATLSLLLFIACRRNAERAGDT